MAPIPEHISTVADCPEGQLPRPYQEGEHEPDQEVIEELQCVANNCCAEDFDLVAGQSPAIENLEHGVSPLAPVRIKRASRRRTAVACDAILPMRRPATPGRRGARLRLHDHRSAQTAVGWLDAGARRFFCNNRNGYGVSAFLGLRPHTWLISIS
jgi:hypothetical protein